jgi:pre-rRNA-processing protein TSR3
LRRRTTLPTGPSLDKRPIPRIMIYDYHQDDPRKCTSTKLEKLRLAEPLHNLRQIPRSAIVLNPVSNRTLSFQDRPLIQKYGLVGLDCSWNHADTVFQDNIKGENRRLPTLLAGNPTNYSIRGRLSTVEALAATLIITGFDERAKQLLASFNWGETFLTLNKEPLREYTTTPPDQMLSRELEYFAAEPA